VYKTLIASAWSENHAARDAIRLTFCVAFVILRSHIAQTSIPGIPLSSMDQDAFRQTYREVNAVFCAFEKSVLTNECGCRCAERFCIAEREGVHCTSQTGQQRCLRWLELLREQARFALRTEEDRRVLPHGKAIRLQVGGMRGLLKALEISDPVIGDVDGSLAEAELRFGALEDVPFSQIMREVVAHQVRRRSRRGR
jgi:hypothetical protein